MAKQKNQQSNLQIRARRPLDIIDFLNGTFTPEARMEMFVSLICLYTAQLITERLLRRASDKEAKELLFEKQKWYLNNAIRDGEGMIKNLERALNDTFDKLYDGQKDRYDVVKHKANLYFQLLSLVIDRSDKDPSVMGNIIAQLKDMEGTGDIRFNELFSYYSAK